MAQSNEEAAAVCFDRTCTIERIGELKEAMLEALGRNSHVLCDFSQIETTDLAFIQFLYAAKREAKARGGSLHLTGRVPADLRENLLVGGFCSATAESGEELERFLYDFD